MANQPSFMIDFIDLYRKHKSLWKIKDSMYCNRALRTKGYEELLQLYRTVDTDATVETVKTKINNMRSAFRRELKKVKLSKRSGSSDDELYTPSLWYYDNLLFTADHEECRKTLSTCEDKQDENERGNNEENELESDLGSVESLNPFSPTSPTPTTTSETTFPSTTPTSTTPKRAKVAKHDVMLEKAYEVLTKRDDNEFKTVGANIAWKLERMEGNQRNIAEHLINTILYYGISKKLTDDVTINLHPPNRSNIYAPHNMYSHQDSINTQAQNIQPQYTDFSFPPPVTQSQIQSGSQPLQLQFSTQPSSAHPTSYLQSSTLLQMQPSAHVQLRYQGQSQNQPQQQLHTQAYSHPHTPPHAEPNCQLSTHSKSQSTQHLTENDTDFCIDNYVVLPEKTPSGL